jgi:hypothetical protein
MLGRLPIVVAVVAVVAIVAPAAHGQSVTDPSNRKAAGTSAVQEIDSDGRSITPPPTVPDVPPLLPGRPSPGLPHSPAVGTTPGQFAPPPNSGPVTGYGPGGMAPMPGTPANPPYSYGPLR